MTIGKEDLIFKHYAFGAGDVEVDLKLYPTRATFNRYNGEHILCLVNWVASTKSSFDKGDLLTLENIISDELPFVKMSERSVCDWVEARLG